jgi:hypothetical protein
MNEYDSEVAHPGNGINTSKTTALRPIRQFAIDRPPERSTACTLPESAFAGTTRFSLIVACLFQASAVLSEPYRGYQP